MKKAKWFVPGDIDGFFGLMLDNLIQLLVLVGLCSGLCGFPMEFIFGTILPGAAVSLIFGNLFYAYQAYKLAEKEGRDDVTALPYGLNTVSLFAFIFGVILPVYLQSKDYKLAWKVGLVACFLSGLIEFFGSFIAEFIRKNTPRAALLSALSGIAITFISMDFLIKTFNHPLIAFIPFGIILINYFGKAKFFIPGGLLSVLAGTAIAWSAGLWEKPMMNPETVTKSVQYFGFYLPHLSISEVFGAIFGAFSSTGESNVIKDYASIIIPMGLMNVVGSLQNIESAEAAGDKFDTRNSLLVNGAGTILGSFLGSPFPTTIYIGHPGWKALGARIGYSVINAAFMSMIGFFGVMSLLSAIIPEEAGMSIILWIGIVIGAQAFESTPIQHAPAIIIGLFPALAGWAVLMVQNMFNFANGKLGEVLAKEGINKAYSIYMSDIPSGAMLLPYSLSGVISLSQGFLLSSMIWAAICVNIIDRKFKVASYWALVASAFSCLGLIHSYKLLNNIILNDYSFPAAKQFVVAYILLAALLYVSSFITKRTDETP
ncbi:MAG: NCS2 family permease [Leptospiraceae bacterium]|nr:NCS2 family permease [Leptospiraceae bacterium]